MNSYSWLSAVAQADDAKGDRLVGGGDKPRQSDARGSAAISHRDKTERFDAGNMPILHEIMVLITSLPIFLLPLHAHP